MRSLAVPQRKFLKSEVAMVKPLTLLAASLACFSAPLRADEAIIAARNIASALYKTDPNAVRPVLEKIRAATGDKQVQPARITVRLDKPGQAVSPLLYGVFFEEIHRAGEGGVYAEKVMNRSFEEKTLGWSLVQSAGARGTMATDRTLPLNANNPTALKLSIAHPAGGRVGVANAGFWNPANGDGWSRWFYASRRSQFSGMDIRRGAGYRYRLYARSAAPLAKPLTVTLERADGTVLAGAKIEPVGPIWKKYEGEFAASGNEPNARLVVAAAETGTVWLDMVSLFPKDTYKGLPLRKDLMELMAAMKPGFLRFPGGTFIQGFRYENAFHWKQTIGDPAQRVARPGFWGYIVDRGLGFHEYLLMAEALGAEPLFCCYAGIGPGSLVPTDQMPPLVQDALDAIEYANGDARSTRWGAERAKNGHPAPFNMNMIEIGNENWGKEYRDRYLLFYKAIKSKHPAMRIITSEGALVGGPAPLEILDHHHYEGPDWFVANSDHYADKHDKLKADNYAWLEANPELGDTGGAKSGGKVAVKPPLSQPPKIFVGEYAAVFGCGMGNMRAAVAEAAFLTGLENRPDLVAMTCYAPYFTQSAWCGWWPSAVVFDGARGFGTASYQGQKLFGRNRADICLESQVESPEINYPYPSGTIGVGLRGEGEAEFKDIKVTRGDDDLFTFHPRRGLDGWLTGGGKWEVVGDAVRVSQSPFFRDHLFSAMLDGKCWSDLTMTLKLRRTKGDGAIDILFNATNPKRIHGWTLANKDHQTGNANAIHGVIWHWHPNRPLSGGGLENGRWYDVRVEVHGGKIRCWLDGQLKEDTAYPLIRTYALHVAAGRVSATGETVLKVVNVADQGQTTRITLAGVNTVASKGKKIVLTSECPADVNTFDQPLKIAPQEQVIDVPGSTFTHTFPPNSITVLRLSHL